MTNMRAMVMPQTGDPDVLTERDIPAPVIENPTEVLIRLQAAGVNPIDTKLRRHGTFFPERLPAVLGCDGAGVVEVVGSGVTRFQPGDAVYFCSGGIGARSGTYARYCVVEEHVLAMKPASVDFVHAAAVPLVAITAWEALHDRTAVQPGSSVLIQGGAGGVGHVAVQLAHLAGARVAATVSDDAKATFAESLGTDYAIRYRDNDVTAAIMNWTGERGVDIAMDNIGGALLEQTFPAVRFYGDVVSLLLPDPATDWRIARQRNLRTSLEVMLTPMLFNLVEAEAHQAYILDQCARLIDAGKLQVHVSDVLSLANAADAHRQIETGSTTGKIVLRID